MKRLVLAVLAAVLPCVPALAQQDGHRHVDHERQRYNDRRGHAPEGVTRVGEANPYEPKAGAANPYATQGGTPNPYATQGGRSNPHATQGGSRGRYPARGVDPNGTPPAPAILKPGASRH